MKAMTLNLNLGKKTIIAKNGCSVWKGAKSLGYLLSRVQSREVISKGFNSS